MAALKQSQAPHLLTVKDLPRLFSATYAENVEANYRLNIRDEQGETKAWTFTVHRGKCGLLPGDDFEADVVFVLDPPTLEELITGLNDVATLYQHRKLGIKGNIDLAIRFPRLFSYR
jgi:hypothetical protein